MASTTPECTARLREHLLGHLACAGRHTLTSLITTFGRQFQDWSAHYQLYSQDRVYPDAIFNTVRKGVESLNKDCKHLCVAIDDTIVRKTGKCIPGTAYRRDPLGPAFQVQLAWSQRFQQFSAAVPGPDNEVRMIPIGYHDACTPRKPRKGSSAESMQVYEEQMKQKNLNSLAINHLQALQDQRTKENKGITPDLRVLVDGSYTNKTVLRQLPAKTTLIGRIRKDAKLSALPPPPKEGAGRRCFYGEDLPTPEQIRCDDSIPWQKVRVRAAGQWREMDVKTQGPVRWRVAGEKNLLLIVVRPVGYRPRQGGRLLYRQPAYLICTDPNLPLESILQEYIWRWDIEVNHRDEKTILGVGQAQVRNQKSVSSVPAIAVAAYAMLHLAAIRAYGFTGLPGVIAPAKWRDPALKLRASTQDLLSELRRELWTKAIRPSYLTNFFEEGASGANSVKFEPNLYSSLFCVNQ